MFLKNVLLKVFDSHGDEVAPMLLRVNTLVNSRVFLRLMFLKNVLLKVFDSHGDEVAVITRVSDAQVSTLLVQLQVLRTAS